MLKFAKWAVGLLALLSSHAATAETYPTRPVRIIVPYQAGQGTDVVARYLAEQLSRTMGQRFYIENKPGAGGNIGTEAAAHAEADGYTLLMGTNATQTMNEFMYPSLGFEPARDFAPIILVGKLPLVISASPSFAGNSVADLIAAAKATPDKVDIALPPVPEVKVLADDHRPGRQAFDQDFAHEIVGRLARRHPARAWSQFPRSLDRLPRPDPRLHASPDADRDRQLGRGHRGARPDQYRCRERYELRGRDAVQPRSNGL